MKVYNKVVSDLDFHGKGRNFAESWYNVVIDSDQDGYFIDSSGNKRVLFRFRKQKIPEKYQQLAITSFVEHSKLKHSNRGVAAGIPAGQKNARHNTSSGQSEGGYIASNISGYFDRPLREHRGILGTIKVCRTTSFTLNNKLLWEQGLPFLVYCSRLYGSLGGKYYLSQQSEWGLIKPELKIPGTVFTTITSNYNWRTACHTDRGDYSGGLGNLVVVGRDFEGGYLGFPQFKVLIKIRPGDFLLMDVHQYHCNTPIKTKGDGFRLSFVMYIRHDMKGCSRSKMVNNVNYYL